MMRFPINKTLLTVEKKIRFFTALMFLLLLFSVSGCRYSHRLVPTVNPPSVPSFYVPKKIRVALVLGSGGVRGMAHVGVIEELEAAGISVDLIVGCSAGSIVGALYADNPCAKYIKEAVWNLKAASLLDFDLWQCRYGLCQGRSLSKVLNKYLKSETFEELKIPLVIVASDLNSGELIPIGSGDVEKAVQASCSIPFIFVPQEHLGRILVDGGVVNPVPVEVAFDIGAELIIAVDLCELLPRTFPTNLFEVATRSAEIAFMWQNETCCHHADVIIRPKTCDIGTFSDHLRDQIYEAGRRAAREKIPDILKKLDALKANSINDSLEEDDWCLYSPQCYTPQIYLKKTAPGSAPD
ncbi:putative NTE family protein YlbK [Neochlamydia sp. EPS4]|nr:putative NTE family protein YlbK [Neochlamydia sp. EPS4]